MKRIILAAACFCVFFLSSSHAADDVTLRSGGESPLQLTFRGSDGNLAAIEFGGRKLTIETDDPQAFDIQEDKQWVFGRDRENRKLLGIAKENERRVVVTTRIGVWEVETVYELEADKPRFRRSAKLTYRGQETVKLRSFWFSLPPFAFGKDTYFFSPTAFPPRDFRPNAEGKLDRRHFGGSLAPVVVELHPKCSLLFFADDLVPNADRAGVDLEERHKGLRVAQSFGAAGYVKPGQSQQLGDAWCGIYEGDAESALRGLHDWMKSHGHTVPADRAAWLDEAILYSFHPGGTTGSRLRDLGGFKAATGLLDAVRALGTNSVWVMPIEDESLYSPRDYYKFQPGLGTPEEYKAFVARAHELKLDVLQDNVPHGGRDSYPRSKEHPEWLLRDEEGKTLAYWCYDFNWPSWQDYIADVIRFYMKEYDLDGFRVDAVSGSKIANWNPDIPYDRASFALLQGGLGMLRKIRVAVKEVKPEKGAVLAETQGSIFGVVSDAVYDFTICYNAFQHSRWNDPKTFVDDMRLWLHRQQFGETPDMIRMRHVESHDSLRAQLTYGIEPSRAHLALTAWIHGMPLVYHEQEDGHAGVFRKIFAIRRALPEMNGGAADYLSVRVPDGVFAVLRTQGDDASVAVVNYNPLPLDKPIEVAIPVAALPEALRTKPVAFDCWEEKDVALTRGDDAFSCSLALPPYGFTVVTLGGKKRDVSSVALAPPVVSPTSENKMADQGKRQRLSGDGWVLEIDTATGLPAAYAVQGKPMLGRAELFLPPGYRAKMKVSPLPDARPEAPGYKIDFGNAALELRYEAAAKFPWAGIKTKWSGNVPKNAALYLPVVQASQWSAYTAEGVLSDAYRVRHLSTDGVVESIYWRPQGTNVIYDSLVVPSKPEGALLAAANSAQSVSLAVADDSKDDNTLPPARVQWIDRLGDRHELGAMLYWSDAESLPGSLPQWECTLMPGDYVAEEKKAAASPMMAGGLVPVSGGWEYVNDTYRVRLTRSGMLSNVWVRKAGRPDRAVLRDGDLYTDVGFGKPDEKLRYSQRFDVEAASRFWMENGVLHACFSGQLRGMGRFEKLNPPITYTTEYSFDAGPTFRMTSSVTLAGAPRDGSGFLALYLPTVGTDQFAFYRDKKKLIDRKIGNESGRLWQSRAQNPAVLPDRIELGGSDGGVLTLTELASGGATASPNIFMLRNTLFLAYDDGVTPVGAGESRFFSFLCTPGGREVTTAARYSASQAALPAHATEKNVAGVATSKRANRLRDGGFESVAAFQLESVTTGAVMPRMANEAGWQLPVGGRFITDPVRAGSAAVEIVNTDVNSYAMLRQQLPLSGLSVGKKYRLSGFLKGKDVKVGDIGWKTASLRFGVQADGKTQYVGATGPAGTFDWKKGSVDLVIPEKLTGLTVEAGLNGATGTLWIDELELVPLD